MTEERLALSELLEKAGEGDFLRAVAEAVLQLLMETDVEGLIELRDPQLQTPQTCGERTTWRNGPSFRPWIIPPRSGPADRQPESAADPRSSPDGYDSPSAYALL